MNTPQVDWAEFMQDDRHQYLLGMPEDLHPWIGCEFWDMDTACQMITLGCKIEIEKHRAISQAPIAAPNFHAWQARTICEVYDRAKSVAELSSIAGRATPAHWLNWAKLLGYDVTHLAGVLKPKEPHENRDESDDKPTANWKLQVQMEAAELWRTLSVVGCSPTKNNIKNDLARICREKNIKTDGLIFPSADYIQRHALRTWEPPTD